MVDLAYINIVVLALLVILRLCLDFYFYKRRERLFESLKDEIDGTRGD